MCGTINCSYIWRKYATATMFVTQQKTLGSLQIATKKEGAGKNRNVVPNNFGEKIFVYCNSDLYASTSYFFVLDLDSIQLFGLLLVTENDVPSHFQHTRFEDIYNIFRERKKILYGILKNKAERIPEITSRQ